MRRELLSFFYFKFVKKIVDKIWQICFIVSIQKYYFYYNLLRTGVPSKTTNPNLKTSTLGSFLYKGSVPHLKLLTNFGKQACRTEPLPPAGTGIIFRFTSAKKNFVSSRSGLL